MRYLFALALLLAPVAAAETIVVQDMCGSREPESVWDMPLCEDVLFDDTLLEAIERGDRSALELARRRYLEAATWRQKLRLAPVLLHDPAVWKELARHAQNALDPEVDQPEWRLALDAFTIVVFDPRSRALARKGLESSTPDVVAASIAGLARERDLQALPLIEKALARMPDDAWWLAVELEAYGSEAARQVAMKYLRTGDE